MHFLSFCICLLLLPLNAVEQHLLSLNGQLDQISHNKTVPTPASPKKPTSSLREALINLWGPPQATIILPNKQVSRSEIQNRQEEMQNWLKVVERDFSSYEKLFRYPFLEKWNYFQAVNAPLCFNNLVIQYLENINFDMLPQPVFENDTVILSSTFIASSVTTPDKSEHFEPLYKLINLCLPPEADRTKIGGEIINMFENALSSLSKVPAQTSKNETCKALLEKYPSLLAWISFLYALDYIDNNLKDNPRSYKLPYPMPETSTKDIVTPIMDQLGIKPDILLTLYNKYYKVKAPSDTWKDSLYTIVDALNDYLKSLSPTDATLPKPTTAVS